VVVTVMATTVKVIDELVAATNTHDIEQLVACFSPSYVNVTPAHPARGFRGSDQVRRNWTSIFAAVPDIASRLIASAVADGQVWTEWEMSGTRRDGTPHRMAGVIIFGVEDNRIVSARFYLEPVETASGDADTTVRRLTQDSR
jgi:ketosteroid isomerase-like protein